MDTRDLVAIITAAVALYGAILSTYNAVLNHRASRGRLKVVLSCGVVADAAVPRTVVLMSAANAGQRVVRLKSAAIRFPDGRQFMPTDPPLGRFLPVELKEGQSLTIPIPIGHLAQALYECGYRDRVKLRAEFRDSLDKEHLSEYLRSNVKDLAELAIGERA